MELLGLMGCPQIVPDKLGHFAVCQWCMNFQSPLYLALAATTVFLGTCQLIYGKSYLIFILYAHFLLTVKLHIFSIELIVICVFL